MSRSLFSSRLAFGTGLLVAAGLVGCILTRAAQPSSYEFNDSHLHLTNYIQEGTNIRDLIKIMGTKAGRVALFGIPLQQTWSHRVDGERAPTYYLNSDAPLYYYSFTDAWIAMAYKSLPKNEQARFDPMITGFNPSDMYASDHIRRVLETFPGVFTGIGEFTIHKEFVSSKIPGQVASLHDPALDRILNFAADVGLLVLIHNDIDVPFAKEGSTPAYLDEMKALFKRHPETNIIWAHTGVGRVVRPIKQHAANLEQIICDPAFTHVYFDLSWDEVAKYVVASAESVNIMANLLNKYPDRFLYGSDEVAPANQLAYWRLFKTYEPLWSLLEPAACRKVKQTNYERLFDEARKKVRAWESRQSTVARAH
jgi:hypothetical protein